MIVTAKDGRQWTDEKPTEPGNYWLRLEPTTYRELADKARELIDFPFSVPTCLEAVIADGRLHADPLFGPIDSNAISQWTEDALWSKRETPADPFEVVNAGKALAVEPAAPID